MSLVVLGTVALDNVKTPSGTKKDMLGGSAMHFAMSARLFTDVHIAGVIGKDFPEKHLEFLKRKHIGLESLHLEKGKTFRWRGEYKKDDLDTAITLNTQLGVLEGFMPPINEFQANMPSVFLGNYDPELQEQFLKQMKEPKLIAMDTMNLWINLRLKYVRRMLKLSHILIVNDGEARMLSKEDNVIKAAKRLYQMGPKIVVVKKGEHGVLCYTEKFMFGFPAYPVEKVVDPTGAGDTFAGGLMGYLTKTSGRITETHLRQAVLYASALASYNVEGFGMGRVAPLTMRDVEKRKKFLAGFCSS